MSAFIQWIAVSHFLTSNGVYDILFIDTAAYHTNQAINS